MKIKKLIIKSGIILMLFGSVACKNKNIELEKKIANLEKQNAELSKKNQEQQNLANIKTNEIKKEEKSEIPSKPKKNLKLRRKIRKQNFKLRNQKR